MWENNIKLIKNNKLEIKPYVTYNVKELANFFPNNINPTWIEALKTNAVMMAQRKHKMNIQILLVAAIAFAIIMGSIMIFLKVYHVPDPQVIVQTVEAGVKVAQANASIMV